MDVFVTSIDGILGGKSSGDGKKKEKEMGAVISYLDNTQRTIDFKKS